MTSPDRPRTPADAPDLTRLPGRDRWAFLDGERPTWRVGDVHSCAVLNVNHTADSTCVYHARKNNDQTWAGWRPAGMTEEPPRSTGGAR